MKEQEKNTLQTENAQTEDKQAYNGPLKVLFVVDKEGNRIAFEDMPKEQQDELTAVARRLLKEHKEHAEQ